MRWHQTKPVCMVRRRSTVRFRNGAPGGLHVLVRPIFTFGSDILARPWRGWGLLACRAQLVFAWWLGACAAWFRAGFRRVPGGVGGDAPGPGPAGGARAAGWRRRAR